MVLLVEDNPINALLARTLLAREGCIVDHAGGGEQALAALKVGQYDLILMDMRMPGLSGEETARRLRGAGIRTPIGIKVFGKDLTEMERLAREIETVVKEVPGTTSAFAERITGGYYLNTHAYVPTVVKTTQRTYTYQATNYTKPAPAAPAAARANPAARALLVAHGLSPPAPFKLDQRAEWSALQSAAQQAVAATAAATSASAAFALASCFFSAASKSVFAAAMNRANSAGATNGLAAPGACFASFPARSKNSACGARNMSTFIFAVFSKVDR